jgi:hypothetical protein
MVLVRILMSKSGFIIIIRRRNNKPARTKQKQGSPSHPQSSATMHTYMYNSNMNDDGFNEERATSKQQQAEDGAGASGEQPAKKTRRCIIISS